MMNIPNHPTTNSRSPSPGTARRLLRDTILPAKSHSDVIGRARAGESGLKMVCSRALYNSITFTKHQHPGSWL